MLLTLEAAAASAPAASEPVALYIGRESSLPFVDTVLADAASAIQLIERQLAIPLRTDWGPLLLLAALITAVGLVCPVRKWLLSRLSTVMKRFHGGSALTIYTQAVAAIVLTTGLFILAGQVVWQCLDAVVPLLPESALILRSCAGCIAIAGLGLGIGGALRSPDDKTHRPVQMPPGLGRAIGFYPFASGAMLGITGVIDQTSRALGASATSWTIAQSLIVVAEALVITKFLILAGRARKRQVDSAAAGGDVAAMPAVFGMTAIVWAALLVGIGAAATGYTRFAMLIMQEVLWAALVLTVAWLLTRFFDALVAKLFNTDRGAGRFATSVVGVQQARLAQAALIGSAALTVVIWLAALALVVAPLQGGGAAVSEQVTPSPMLAWVQSLDISPRTVAFALVVLFGGIALTRTFRRWLETRFLPATSLDIGARTSIVTGLGYAGVIIAMLSATSALGVRLESITLIASALSVGIGFGLQSILQNFVSGLILLIERPVKPGDWVSVAGAEGNIRKIRVRATELATADGGISIVPNSAFISSTVANRADTLMSARLEMALTLSGCPSAVAARDLLQDVVGRCPSLRDDPRPRLYLRTLGDESWTFDLRAYGQPTHSLSRARSDLLFWLSDAAMGQDIRITLA